MNDNADNTNPDDIDTQARQVADQLLERFPAACRAGGDEEALAFRLQMIGEVGHETMVAGLRALFPGAVAEAEAAGWDELHTEALLWALLEDLRQEGLAKMQQPPPLSPAEKRLLAKQAEAAKRKRAQAKASRRANRRR